MADNEAIKPPFYYKIERIEVIKTTILGALVGVITPLLGLLINTWIVTPIFCLDPNSFGVCSNGGLISYYISGVLIAIAATALMANWSIYRPVIISFGALVALWGLKSFIESVFVNSALEYYLISALLFGTIYLLFYWFMRIRSFGLSVVMAIAAITVVRWALLI